MEIIEGIRAEAEGLVTLGRPALLARQFSRAFRDHNSKVTFLGNANVNSHSRYNFFRVSIGWRLCIESEFREIFQETRQKFLNSPEVDLAN